MAKRENLNKLNLSLLKTLTLREELVKEIYLVRLKFHQCQWSINDQAYEVKFKSDSTIFHRKPHSSTKLALLPELTFARIYDFMIRL
jgi:hypothetical protein